MHLSHLVLRNGATIVALLLAANLVTHAREPARPAKFPAPEKLTYRIEWRLITAGTATIELSRGTPDDWETKLDLQSAGLVTRLYRVLDSYRATTNDHFCAFGSQMDAQEGKRHAVTHLSFDNAGRKVTFEERDLITKTSTKKVIDDTPPCTYEITGALLALRNVNLQPGKSMTLPITDGKKLASARIEAQSRETLNVGKKTYQTIRYEAFLFDNVLYRRKGRLLIWLTDDAERLPVQFRMQMGFPIGNVTVELQSQEKLNP